MAFLQSFKGHIFKTGVNTLKLCSAFTHSQSSTSGEMLKEVQETKKKGDLSSFTHRQSNISEAVFKEVQQLRKKEDLPVEMENPFVEEKPKCLLCKYDIEPNFRNVRLLSQFVSSYTGRVYGRHITGLCEYKQKLLEIEIRKAQTSGLMGIYVKDPNFLADPDLYDPTKPFKVL